MWTTCPCTHDDRVPPSDPHTSAAATARRALPRITGPDGRPKAAWRIVAEAIAALVEAALADPDHPWTRHWPSSSEMADQFDVPKSTVAQALRHLAGQGLLAKTVMPAAMGGTARFVPAVRAPAFVRSPSVDEVAAWLADQAMRGAFDLVPPYRELAGRLGVRVRTIPAALGVLADRGLAHRVRVRGVNRWWIAPPHELRSRPRARPTAYPIPLAYDDVLRRIRDGEFRYRTPDGRVHEAPFPTFVELAARYGGSQRAAAQVHRAVREAGLIVPGPNRSARFLLAPHVPAVDRHASPPPPPLRTPRPRNKRAHEIAEAVLRRIRAGEFADRPLPTQTDLIAEYRVGWHNVRAAYVELRRRGWVEFRFRGTSSFAVLAANPPRDDA